MAALGLSPGIFLGALEWTPRIYFGALEWASICVLNAMGRSEFGVLGRWAGRSATRWGFWVAKEGVADLVRMGEMRYHAK